MQYLILLAVVSGMALYVLIIVGWFVLHWAALASDVVIQLSAF
jgi:hypothetical protein